MMMAQQHSAAMDLGQLLPGAALAPEIGSRIVSGLSLDSRSLSQGAVFVALPGETVDGRDFIDAAIERDLSAVLAHTDDDQIHVEYRGETPVVSLPGLADEVSAIASRFYSEPSEALSMFGVTGTNGKTSCVQWLAQLHALLGKRAATVGTLGYGLVGIDGHHEDLTETGFTTPNAIDTQKLLAQLRDTGAEAVAMEVSSHSLCQGRVTAVSFDTALYTNLSRDHLDYHGTMDAYAEAKQRLFAWPDLTCAVINVDDGWGAGMCAAVPENVTLIRYSLSNSRAEVYAKHVRYLPDGIEAEVVSPWGSGQLCCPVLGEFNLSNLLGVIAACVSASNEPARCFADVLAALPKLKPVAGRMESLDASADIRVIIDYAHTPDALEKTLRALHTHSPGKVSCLFGCGGDRDRGKRAEMGAVAARLADRLVITSDNPRTESPRQIIDDIVKGIEGGLENSDSSVVIESRAQAIATAIAEAASGDTLLLAGKGHEDYQIVGTEKLPFSDFAEARRALKKRREVQQ